MDRRPSLLFQVVPSHLSVNLTCRGNKGRGKQLFSALILAILVLSGGIATYWKRVIKEAAPQVIQHITVKGAKSAGRQIGEEAVQTGVERLVKEQLAIPATDTQRGTGMNPAAIAAAEGRGQGLAQQERLEAVEKELEKLKALFGEVGPKTPPQPGR